MKYQYSIVFMFIAVNNLRFVTSLRKEIIKDK